MVDRLKALYCLFQAWTCALAMVTRLARASGSLTAISASILRLISTPAFFKPSINWLYLSPCARLAALIRAIQSRLMSPFRSRRCLKA